MSIKYPKEMLEPLVVSSDSMASLMRKLGLTGISGGMHAYLKRRLKTYNIDISHWNGRGANKNKIIPRRKPEDILVKVTGLYKDDSILVLRAMLQKGVPYRCANKLCGISTWLGKFIRLQIEHKNGDNKDNRLENLELLCPNCHTLTPTYAVMTSNRKKGNKSAEELVKHFTAG